MFIFASTLLLIAVISVFVGRSINAARKNAREDEFHFFPIISWSIVGIAGLLFLLSCLTTVSAGHVGVPVVFGSVQDYYVAEGIHFINPFASVQQMSVRSEEYTMVSNPTEGQKEGDDSIFAQSSNGVVLQTDITVLYKLTDADAPWVYKHLGPHYAESIMRPAARSAVPDSTSKFTFEEAYASKREQVAERIRIRMNEKVAEILKQYPGFKDTAVLVQSVFMRKLQPSPDLLKSIEEKMKRDQEQQAMDYVIERETKEAHRKKIEAGGIKDFQEIVTQGITPSLLEWKAIEATEKIATSDNAKVVVVGNGKGNLPVLLSGNQ